MWRHYIKCVNGGGIIVFQDILSTLRRGSRSNIALKTTVAFQRVICEQHAVPARGAYDADELDN